MGDDVSAIWPVVLLSDPEDEDGISHYVKPGHLETLCGLGMEGEWVALAPTNLPTCGECVTAASLAGYQHPLRS